jgi:hypothetical protein
MVKLAIKAEGALLIVGGLLTILNFKILGGLTLLLGFSVIVGTKDNGLLDTYSRLAGVQGMQTPPLAFLKYLSFIGGALMLIADRGGRNSVKK